MHGGFRWQHPASSMIDRLLLHICHSRPKRSPIRGNLLSLKGDKDLHRNDPRLVCPVHDLARDNDCCQMQKKLVLQTQSVNTMSTADDIALLLDQEKMTPNPSRTWRRRWRRHHLIIRWWGRTNSTTLGVTDFSLRLPHARRRPEPNDEYLGQFVTDRLTRVGNWLTTVWWLLHTVELKKLPANSKRM
jgi:hypothetical protein